MFDSVTISPTIKTVNGHSDGCLFRRHQINLIDMFFMYVREKLDYGVIWTGAVAEGTRMPSTSS